MNETFSTARVHRFPKTLRTYQVVHFQPFDPVHKRTEATVKAADGKQFNVAKGAPQVILEMSANAGEVKPAVEMGVNVKMVTGDQVAIAQETARQLGLGTNILDASGLGDTKLGAGHCSFGAMLWLGSS